MAIGVTLLEQYAPAPRNTLLLFDRRGRLALTYAKVHTCDFGDERVLTRGESFPVAALDTAAGPVQVGAMICYDREFPRKRPPADAERRRADPGAQRLPHGPEPAGPAARPRL